MGLVELGCRGWRGKMRGESGYLLGQLRDLGDHGLVVVGEVPKCLLVLPQEIVLAGDCFPESGRLRV